MKKIRSFRIDTDVMKALELQGLDANQIVRAALAKAVKINRCPYCSQEIKKK